MNTDRDGAGVPDPESGSPLPDEDSSSHPPAAPGPTAPSPSPAQPSPAQPPAEPAQQYGYGTPAPDAAMSGPASGSALGVDAGSAPESDQGAESATGQDPATDAQSPTALRNATAPRAVLRPVPEGFPTPPPQPVRPNRRPAQKLEQAPQPPRRGPLIASLIVVVVLVLVVAIGGSILAYRALSADPSPASDPASTADGSTAAGAGEVAIGDVTAREVSTELGVRQLGNGASDAAKPEGEFIIVTVEIENGSDSSVTFAGDAPLETADGETYGPDGDAAAEYVSETTSYGLVGTGDTTSFHLVYDVPVGSEPAAVQLDFSTNPSAGTGALPVGG